MEDVIQIQDQFYALATASHPGERSAVLQHNDTFAVFDLYGDIGTLGADEQGRRLRGARDQVIRLPLFVVGSRLNLADVAVQAIGDGRRERCVARVQNGNLK